MLETAGEENKDELSERYEFEAVKDCDLKIFEKFILGDLEIPALSVKFDPFERHIAASFYDGTIKLFDGGNGKLKSIMNVDINPEYAVSNIRWRPMESLGEGESLLSVDVMGNIKRWDIEKGKERACVNLPDVQLSALDYKPDGL